MSADPQDRFDDKASTLASVIKQAIRNADVERRTCLPGRVVSYDKAKQLANVKIVVRNKYRTADGETIAEPFPVLPNVPVAHPRGGGAVVLLPMKEGDYGMLVFADSSIDLFVTKGGDDLLDPIERRFDINDAYFIPGGWPVPEASAVAEDDALVIGMEEGPKAYFQDGVIALGEKAPAEFVALAQKTFDAIDGLRADVASFVTTFNSHGHVVTGTLPVGPVAAVAAPPASPATPPATIPDVAAETVKAK